MSTKDPGATLGADVTDILPYPNPQKQAGIHIFGEGMVKVDVRKTALSRTTYVTTNPGIPVFHNGVRVV
jgi:hypothetical protein